MHPYGPGIGPPLRNQTKSGRGNSPLADREFRLSWLTEGPEWRGHLVPSPLWIENLADGMSALISWRPMYEVYRTKCGGAVVVPPKASYHLQAHPGVLQILEEGCALLELPTDGSFLTTTVDFGRVVGGNSCIPTETIKTTGRALFAHRHGRPGPSRVVVVEELPPTTTLAIIAFQSQDRRTGRREPGTYVLVTAFPGDIAEREPWDRNFGTEQEARKALQFWCRHALAHDPKVMGEVFESTWADILHLR